MDELPTRAKEVLRHAQGYDACRDHGARRRVREGVAKAVGASVLVVPRGDAQPTLPSAALPSGLLGKVVVGTFLVALVGAGIALRQQPPAERKPRTASAAPDTPDTSAAPASEPAPSAQALSVAQRAATPDAPLGLTQSDLPRRAATRARTLETTPAATRDARDTLDSEVTLLRQVEDAVGRRDSGEAQRLLAQHRARFAQPALLEERRGFQALVRCMVNSSDALASARAFAARYPHSVLAARVRAACQQAAGER